MKYKETIGLRSFNPQLQQKVQRGYFFFFLFTSFLFQQKILKLSQLQDFSSIYNVFLWSWRDSNPRPNEELICFLHAYLRLDFRLNARPEPPTLSLFHLFHLKSGTYFKLSPILLYHRFGLLRSHSFRVISRPNTWCKDKAYESTILRSSSESVIIFAS